MERTRVEILPGAYLMAAVFLLTLPLRWVISWMTAAIIHEVSHILAIRICKGTVTHIRVGALGADIGLLPMEAGSELLCALAGPLGGVLPVVLFDRFPCLAVCGLLQSLCNMLPVYPMDGGRVLRSLLVLAAGERAADIGGKWISWLTVALLSAGGIWAFFRLELGLICLFPPLWLMVRPFLRKIPCKRKGLGLQ